MRLRLMLAGAIAATSAAAQSPESVTIAGRPSCGNCNITLTKVAELGRSGDPLSLVNYSSVHRAPRDQFVVINAIDQSNVILFDSAGIFIREIGRQGQGPGAFSEWAFWLGVGRGDSVYFRDRGGQYQVFGPTLENARMISYTGASAPALVLPDGNLVGRLQARRNDPYVNAFQLVSETGKVIRSFGATTPEESSGCVVCTGRHITLGADDSRMWVARRNQYRLERYDLSGTANFLGTVSDSPWMQSWLTEPTAPYTELAGVADMGNGRLLVIGRVPATGSSGFRSANVATWPTAMETSQSTVIDVVDVTRRSVLTSRRLEREIYMIVDARHVARQRRNAAGLVSFDVYRIDVTG